jgi:hypothetical protein
VSGELFGLDLGVVDHDVCGYLRALDAIIESERAPQV